MEISWRLLTIILWCSKFIIIHQLSLQLHWSHRVCKPAYLVPVPSQDKLRGLCQKGHSA